MATKLMTMYISQSDMKRRMKKLRKIIDYDRKTGCYAIAKFYEQIGRLRKVVEEKDEQVALLHTDFSGMLDFNERFGQIEEIRSLQSLQTVFCQVIMIIIL